MIGNNLLMAGDEGYNLTRSLRFRASASATLTRTFGTPTSQNVFTWSAWIKRGTLSANNSLFGDSAGNNVLRFISSDVIRVEGSVSLASTAVFRDPSAMYHIVYRQNGTTATVWVNNNSVLTGTVTVSSLNTATGMTLGGPTSLGSFDGYMAETYFIDGQALTPSSFGSTNSTTGVWQPAAYTGSYGTNGFYLPFTDNSALTTSSNVGLGKDFSGNGNYWVTNNISITAGVTYDSMTDVPTLTSATAANFAMLDPLDRTAGDPVNGNLRYNYSSSSQSGCIRASMGMSSGKYYCEITLTTYAGNNPMCGVISSAGNLGVTTNYTVDQEAAGYSYVLGNGQGISGYKGNNQSRSAYGASTTSGDVVGIAFDASAGTLTFYKNNVSQGTAYSSMAAGTYFFAVSGLVSNVLDANFGQRPFTYTPPTGFVALNAFNLPDSTIKQGNKVMDATLYTGNNLARSITNAAGFKPDLVWVKSRSAATDNKLTDSVRGVTKALVSNSTANVNTEVNGLTAFNSNGWSLGTDTVYNNNLSTYVGWQWQAGQGSSSSNTSGTITSTVSVNASAGFSIATYNGTGANATVGHGLGVAPSMYIVKGFNTTANQSWRVYQAYANASPASGVLNLNATDAFISSSTQWNNTAPTSSVFSIGTDVAVNESSKTYVAYCWSEIAGFSKFGKYTGNGSADGGFIYLGLLAKFILIKRTDTTGNWIIWDTARNTYNVMGEELYPNLSNAGATSVDLDITSNGFKLRSTNAAFNASGGTYIYAAFAENPFKNSLAR